MIKKPMQVPELTTLQVNRFWAKVDKRPDGIWNWIGAKNKKWAQGTFSINRKTYLVHRISWALEERRLGRSGLIPDGMLVLHRFDLTQEICDVNPMNLWLGTGLDNMRDMVLKGRHAPNGQKKITLELANDLRETKRRNPSITYKTLSKLFGISLSHAHRIAVGEDWQFSGERTTPKSGTVASVEPLAPAWCSS